LIPNRISVLHKGRFANAIFYRYKDDSFDSVIKDLQHSPWIVRKIIARFFVNKKYKVLEYLDSMSGVSNQFHCLSNISIAYSFIEVTLLRTLNKQNKKTA
jgi:hypothetical protein